MPPADHPGAIPARRAAVLGSPIAHSLSPALHRAAYARLELPWTYAAIECTRAGLPEMVTSVRDDPGWAGLSLTMPLKLAVLDLLDDVDPLAARVGAVNTVIRSATGHLCGFNTDVAGVTAALSELHLERPPQQALVLGAGGTARAVVAALADFGVRSARVLVRDPARGASLRSVGTEFGLEIGFVRWRDAAEELAGAALVVSTVPTGAETALGSAWPGRAALVDVRYHPWPTGIATSAAAAGAPVVGGLTILVAQAGAQVELMTGLPAPYADMWAAGQAALNAVARPAVPPVIEPVIEPGGCIDVGQVE